MPALFPVVETRATFEVFALSGGGGVTRADERDSAWSLTARVAQSLSQQSSAFALAFDEATKQLTLSGPSVFNMLLSLGADTLTGFAATSTGAASYTGSALSSVITVDGLRMAPPGWSTTTGKPSADGSAVSTPRWTTGAVSLAMSVTYADAFQALKTLRAGVWDVVNEGIWLGRMRVTGSSLEPQGRLPGIVEARINGVAVP